MKKKYFEKKYKEVEGCPRKTWGLIKEGVELKTNSVPAKLISAKGETIKLEGEICKDFQNYFSNIGPNLSMSIVPDICDPTCEFLVRDPIDISLHLNLVTVDEIKQIIYGLRSNSPGSDQITLKTL
ncbi:hypothetical protein QYM36_003648 [Artemia franciscana]|uniref:Uncharacterized protein n=1 Tax=Artemia franciscana TaxID=6661 RepID=A0AA88IIE2_ARTSF|nr:hypothetical protein QYM36_003648 [Artemia franciscana]